MAWHGMGWHGWGGVRWETMTWQAGELPGKLRGEAEEAGESGACRQGQGGLFLLAGGHKESSQRRRSKGPARRIPSPNIINKRR